jgi:hypothetical protein
MPPVNGDWHSVKMHHWDDEAKISILETEKGNCQYMLLHAFVRSYSHVPDMYFVCRSVQGRAVVPHMGRPCHGVQAGH